MTRSLVRILTISLLSAIALASHVSANERAWLTLPATPILPSDGRSATVEVAGAKIWYAEFGAGDPVVLLHGGYANSNYFGNLVPVLAKSHRVIVIDSRGHGRSTLGDVQISYARMADDVVKVLDKLQIKSAPVVGWSDGGVIGLVMAMKHPDRISALFSFGADSDYRVLFDLSKSEVFTAYLQRTAEEYKGISPTPDEFQKFNDNVSKMWYSEPVFTDDDLKSVRVPTWVVDADHEEGLPRSDTDRMFHLIPDASELILPGVSHFAFLQDPETFHASVLSFLRRTQTH